MSLLPRPLYSLSGPPWALMAVGAAQAIDLHFGLYAVAWVPFGLWGRHRVGYICKHGGPVCSRVSDRPSPR